MAAIPEQKIDITLSEIDKQLLIQNKEKEFFITVHTKDASNHRNYLGMSQIGKECWRELFYSFRGVATKDMDPSGIRNIQDGYTQEAIMAHRLRLLPYIELHTTEPDSDEQISFELLLGHFRGHGDGMIKGIKEAPQTWHVWENKAVNETKFNKLKSLKQKDEKSALFNWDIEYYAQAEIYMHCSQTTRHFLTVETPGGRDYVSCRTDYDKKYAEGIIEKAKIIIFDNWTIPARLSDTREFFKCKWCAFQKVCHDGDFPLVNCKTCRYSEPVNGGIRKCLKKDIDITDDFLMKGCQYHVYSPALIQAKLIEQQEDGCIYQTDAGYKFANVYSTGLPELKGKLDAIFPSDYLFNKIKSVNNLTRGIVKTQQMFQGEIVDEKDTPRKAWEKSGLKDI